MNKSRFFLIIAIAVTLLGAGWLVKANDWLNPRRNLTPREALIGRWHLSGEWGEMFVCFSKDKQYSSSISIAENPSPIFYEITNQDLSSLSVTLYVYNEYIDRRGMRLEFSENRKEVLVKDLPFSIEDRAMFYVDNDTKNCGRE